MATGNFYTGSGHRSPHPHYVVSTYMQLWHAFPYESVFCDFFFSYHSVSSFLNYLSNLKVLEWSIGHQLFLLQFWSFGMVFVGNSAFVNG